MVDVNNKVHLVSFLVLCVMSFSGCAHGLVEKQLDEKIAREETVNKRSDLRAESDRLIETAPGLSEEQRKMLRALRDSTRIQSDELREKSLRLRAVLIKDLLSPRYSSDELDLVKAKMKDVEQENLHVFFSSVRQANTILGRWRPQKDEAFYDQMMLMMDPRDL
jgi:hypothetical protein